MTISDDAVIPLSSASSLMVGNLKMESSLDPVVTVDNQDDGDVVAELVLAVRKAWLTDEADSTTDEDTDRELCDNLLEKLVGDRSQLVRILMARKYDIDACVSLVLEQVRFRARWKPHGIQLEDIPNAVPCKSSEVKLGRA